MAAAKKAYDPSIGKLIEEIALLSESDKSDWVKALCKMSWSGKDPVIEVRNYNKTKVNNDDMTGRVWGSGMSFTDEELDILVEELVRLGYGDTKAMAKELKARS